MQRNRQVPLSEAIENVELALSLAFSRTLALGTDLFWAFLFILASTAKVIREHALSDNHS